MRLVFGFGRDWLRWRFGHSAWNSVLALGLWHGAARTAIRSKLSQFPNLDQSCYPPLMKDNDSSTKDMKRRAEAALKRVQAVKAHAPNGNAGRAQDHKGNKVQPAKQRNKLQKGR
jgi:hypothetical protein